MGGQIRTQQALGKIEVEAKLAFLNITGRAVKAQSYTSILDGRLKKIYIILDLSEASLIFQILHACGLASVLKK